MIEQSKL